MLLIAIVFFHYNDGEVIVWGQLGCCWRCRWMVVKRLWAWSSTTITFSIEIDTRIWGRSTKVRRHPTEVEEEVNKCPNDRWWTEKWRDVLQEFKWLIRMWEKTMNDWLIDGSGKWTNDGLIDWWLLSIERFANWREARIN